MMKVLRKGILAVLSAVTALGLFSGCGTADSGSADGSVTLRISMYNDIAYSEWRTYVEKQCPDINFIWENNRNSTQNLIYQAKHGDLADLVMIRRFESDSASELAPYLMDLGSGRLTGTFSEGSLDSFTFDGKICWYPAPGMIEGIYANVSLFQRSGIAVPETTAELEEACGHFHDLGIDGLNIEASQGFRSTLLLEGFSYENYFASAEGREWLKGFLSGRSEALPEKGCRQILSVLRDFRKHYVLEEPDLSVSQAEALSSFDSEKSAMIINGTDHIFSGRENTDYQLIPCLGDTEDDQVLFTYPVFSTAVSKSTGQDASKKAAAEEVLKVMYSAEAQQILSSGADTLISYNKGINLPVGTVGRSVSGLIRDKKTFIRFLNRNMFSASVGAVKDVVENDAADDVFEEDFNTAFGKPADTAVIGKSNVRAGNQLGETWPLEREAASVIAKCVQEQTGADAVLIEGKDAAAPIYQGSYTENDLNAAVVDEGLLEADLTGAQLASVFGDAILATTTYQYKSLEPLVDYPALAGVRARLSADGTDDVLEMPDGTVLDPDAACRVIISQTIFSALTYLKNENADSFTKIDLTLQKAVGGRLSSGTLPGPERYFETEGEA